MEEYKSHNKKFTWQAEYLYGNWRKRDRIYVTKDTKIPEMPKKPMTAPVKTDLYQKVEEIEKKIDELNDKSRLLSSRFTD